MLDWLFGTSKKEKKQEPVHESLTQQEEWVYDFIKQYLVSPIWRNPLMDFIEENCAVFEDAEENKFEYTKIFQEFISICSILIESIVQETGITEKTLEKCIIRGLKSQRDRKIFTQILICDNFQMFKRIMISKNKELETEALKKIREETKTQDKVQDEIDEKERERLQLQQAIALSIALEQKAKDQQQQQLQEAIRQSQISLTSEEKKVQEKQPEKKVQKSLLGDLPPLMLNNSVKTFESQAEYKEEKERLDKELTELRANKKSEEDSQQRKRRLQEQRQLLRKKKQEERQIQLKTFVENKQATSTPEHNVTQEELQRRKKLMNKLKEQLKSD